MAAIGLSDLVEGEERARAADGGRLALEPHPLVFDQVRIENTNHCGYKCFMCPREHQSRALGFMPIEDLALVFDRLGGDFAGEIHLHGFGEPLLDKRLIEKVRLARARHPRAQIQFFTTLGVKLPAGYFESLAGAGIGNVQVSFYGFTPETYAKVTGTNTFELALKNLKDLAAARETTGRAFRITLQTWDEAVWQTWPDEIRRQRRQFLDWAHSIGIARHEVDQVHNYGGGRAYNEPPREGLCSVAWGLRRRILQVSWTLDVIPCCFDFNASVVFGNLRRHSLAEIFAATPYRRFIAAHFENALADYPVCVGCERCFQP